MKKKNSHAESIKVLLRTGSKIDAGFVSSHFKSVGNVSFPVTFVFLFLFHICKGTVFRVAIEF